MTFYDEAELKHAVPCSKDAVWEIHTLIQCTLAHPGMGCNTIGLEWQPNLRAKWMDTARP